jgi:16S rRNA (guanine966-N2)-methyltransferase
VRVVAGKYKRMPLIAPAGKDITRPTSDRARESLFNILSPNIVESCVLDLFAGSGALGIEALSRGAKHAIFVEANSEALACLKQNLNKLKIPTSHYSVFHCSVENFLRPQFRQTMPGWRNAEFAASRDLVFADPPYAHSWYDHSVEDLENSGLCAGKCLTVVEMSSRNPVATPLIPPWNLVDKRTYGAACLVFYQRTETESSHENLVTS